MWTYDVDGWCSGNNPADAAAGRTTDVDPQLVEGGPGKRWDGAQWIEFTQPVVSLMDQAHAELSRTDLEWGGRLVEDAIALAGGTALPAAAVEKLAYREALRQVVAGTLTEMPADPTVPIA